MKKVFGIILAALMVVGFGAFAACGNSDAEKNIFVVSREAGSGTRSAFEEIIGINNNTDLEFDAQENSTNNVITTVENNSDAIGYISLGSLNTKVKALKIDGVEASAAKVKDGTYKIARPFLIVTKKDTALTGLSVEFNKFLTSKQAQDIIAAEKYVTVVDSPALYTAPETMPAGDVSINGSTSVDPLMDKLIGKFVEITGVAATRFSKTATGSGDGIKAATDGNAIFGMSSRELKATEKTTLNELVLCKDGIAIIVNKGNSLSDITLVDLTKVYKKEIAKFSELTK